MKLAIVCPGGGARGRFPAGGLKALGELGWIDQARILTGTSVGGLNLCALAAGLCQGKGAAVLEAVWGSIRRNLDVFEPDLPANGWSLLNPIDQAVWVARVEQFLFGKSLLDNQALQSLCRRWLGSHTTDELEVLTGKVLRCMAFGYKSGQVAALQGRLDDLGLCTSAIEGIFPAWDPATHAPAENAAKEGYGDGGLLDNDPLDQAVALGADHAIILYTGARDNGQDPGHAFTGLSNVMRAVNRVITWNEENLAATAEARLPAGAVIHVYPPQDTGGVLDFSNVAQFAKGYEFTKAFVAQQAQLYGWQLDPAAQEPNPEGKAGGAIGG